MTTTETTNYRIDDPRPLTWAVKVHTPLTTTYMRAFHVLLADPERDGQGFSGDGWLKPTKRDRGVERIEIAEPEFGRGLVFTFRGSPDRATTIVKRMLAEAEVEFTDRERALLADQAKVAREAAAEDASEGL